MRGSNWVRLGGLLALFGLLAAPATAFRMIQPGGNGRVNAGAQVPCNSAGGFAHPTTVSLTWRLNTANQGSGKATAMRNAIASWNDVSESGYVLSYAGTTGAGYVTDNRNTVVWATGNGCGQDCLALTALVIQNAREIVEADITFNDDFTWTTNGNTFDTETVMLHELGHTLGIHHPETPTPSPRPIMAVPYQGKQRWLSNDDRAALRCSYDRYQACTSAPARPQYITGPNNDLCQGAEEVYSTPHVPGAETYRWEVVGQPYSWTTTTNKVTLEGWYFQPGYYTLRVRAQNDCGASSWRQVGLFVLAPSHPACGGCSGWGCFRSTAGD